MLKERVISTERPGNDGPDSVADPTIEVLVSLHRNGRLHIQILDWNVTMKFMCVDVDQKNLLISLRSYKVSKWYLKMSWMGRRSNPRDRCLFTKKHVKFLKPLKKHYSYIYTAHVRGIYGDYVIWDIIPELERATRKLRRR